MEREKTILPLVRRRTDRSLLTSWIEEDTLYEVAGEGYPEEIPQNLDFDLCIFDVRGLREHRVELEERKDSTRPVFLPFLLLVSDRDELDRLITSYRGISRLVDEILRMPTHKFEFEARIENLLSRRSDSSMLKRHLDALSEQIGKMEAEIGDTGAKKGTPLTGVDMERTGDALQEVERQLEQNISTLMNSREKYREAKEELSVLNRVVRHDIRNDMNLVYAWSLELSEECEGETREKLRNIVETSYHILELTQNAKQLIETFEGGEELDLVGMNLARVLREVVETRREMFDNASIELNPEVPDVRVVANPMLPTVFKNIVNNAVQHNDGKKPSVEVSVEEGDGYVTVSIADDGPGVPEAKQDDIFGKGEKGLDSEGTGIGLYLVNSLAQSYGGDVWVEDNEPRGSIFKIQLKTEPGESGSGGEGRTQRTR